MREVGGDGTVDAIGGHVPRTGKGRLKVTVVDIVGSHFRRRASDQFDIVHVNVAAGRGLTQIKVEPRSGRRAGDRHILPLRPQRAVGRRDSPVGDAIIVLGRIDQLQRRPEPVCSRRPRRCAVVSDLVDDDVLIRRSARPDQLQRFATVLQLAVEHASERNRAPVSRDKTQSVTGDNQEPAGRKDAAPRENEARAVQLETGKIERVDRRSVVKFDERRVRQRRVVHDFIDEHVALRRLRGAGVSDGDRIGRAGDRVAVIIETPDGQRIGAAAQRQLDRPAGHRVPGCRISNAVDGDGFHLHGRLAADGDGVFVRAEVVSAVAGDGERRVGAFVVQGAQQGIAHRGDPALHGRRRVDRDAIRGKSGVFCVHDRVDVGVQHRAVGDFLERAEISAAERVVCVDFTHRSVRAVIGEQVISIWSPRTAVTEHDVVVPDQKVPFALGRFVAVHVLRVSAAEGVPVADGVLDGEDAQPFLHVHQVFHVRHVAAGGVRIGGVDQREDVGVIARGGLRFARQIIPAITREFLGAAGGRVIVQRAPRLVVEALAVHVEFKPRLQLVKLAIGIGGKVFIDDVPVRHLRVLHQRAAAVAVHVHRDKTPVIPRQTKLAHHPVARLLALNRVVVERPVARRVDFIERGCAEELVVFRHVAVVMAVIADRRIKLLMVRAAGVTRSHVVNDTVAANPGAVVRFVAHVRQVRPAIDHVLREPQMIRAETARRCHVAKTNDALAHRGAVRQIGRKACRRG